jgi:hypothetical protein
MGQFRRVGRRCSASPIGFDAVPFSGMPFKNSKLKSRTLFWLQGKFMASKKTRFVITVDEIFREILSVEEMADGSLLLFPKRSEQYGSGQDHLYKDAKEVRISVHPSKESNDGGFLLKMHNKWQDNDYFKGYAYVMPRFGRYLWPIYGCTSPDLSRPRYILKKLNDKLIDMGIYKPNQTTLIYMLVVTSKNVRPEKLLKMNVASAQFSNFDLHIHYAFVAYPSIHQGEVAFTATSWTIETQSETIERRVKERYQSLRRGELERFFADSINRLAGQHALKLVNYLESMDPPDTTSLNLIKSSVIMTTPQGAFDV